MNRLQDKVAVITGAGRGIGKATAETFAREGAQVVIADFDEKSGQSTASGINANGGQSTFIPVDVSDADSVSNLFNQVHEKFNRVDILVNNAGILQDSTLKNWRKTNLSA